MAILEARNLPGVDVQAYDVVPEIGETRAGYEPDISGAYDGDFQARSFALSVLIACSAAAGSGAWVIGLPITR
jgi:hypothetical protein